MNVAGFILNENGDAVVESTILFPIMTMVFAALVLIAIYLPAQAILQHSVQYAATALATEISDTWLYFDANEGSMSYFWETDKSRLQNVYAGLFARHNETTASKGPAITRNAEKRSISSRAGELNVSAYIDDKIIYKEITIEASREYAMPVNLSLIGFPETLVVAASCVAVVQNGDEFVRNIDIATDFAQYVDQKFGLSDIGSSVSEFGDKVKSLLGW